MTRKLMIEQASIKTAAVQIKVLAVNDKQVTLSTFRQIEKAPVIDEKTILLRGIPWCRVNYFWGDCKDDHLHVVWQDNADLRRDCVYRYPCESIFKEEEIDRLAGAHILGAACRRKLPNRPVGQKIVDGHLWLKASIGSVEWWVRRSQLYIPSSCESWLTGGSDELSDSERQVITHAFLHTRVFNQEHAYGTNDARMDEITRRVEALSKNDLAQLAQQRMAREVIYDALSKIDHVFIAT